MQTILAGFQHRWSHSQEWAKKEARRNTVSESIVKCALQLLYVHAPLSSLRMYILTYQVRLAPPSSVAFCNNSEHHVSEEESLSQKLIEIKQKDWQVRECKARWKTLLSLKMCCRIEPAGSPTRTQSAVWNASEELKRLTARVKKLELVCVHTRTHTHTHAHTCTHAQTHTRRHMHTNTHTHTHTQTHTHCILFVALSLPSCPDTPKLSLSTVNRGVVVAAFASEQLKEREMALAVVELYCYALTPFLSTHIWS